MAYDLRQKVSDRRSESCVRRREMCWRGGERGSESQVNNTQGSRDQAPVRSNFQVLHKVAKKVTLLETVERRLLHRSYVHTAYRRSICLAFAIHV